MTPEDDVDSRSSTSNTPPSSSTVSSRSSSESSPSVRDRGIRIRYCYTVLQEITAFLGNLINFSPESAQWAHLSGAEWDNDRMKPLLLNFLRSLKGRENERGNKYHAVGQDDYARRHWDAVQGIGQVLGYVAQGLPVLHEKMTERELILMGNRYESCCSR